MQYPREGWNMVSLVLAVGGSSVPVVARRTASIGLMREPQELLDRGLGTGWRAAVTWRPSGAATSETERSAPA